MKQCDLFDSQPAIEIAPVMEASPFYVIGGTMPRGAPSYVERQADRELFNGLCESAFCYVLTARQMGKSSLMVRTASRLRETGVAVAVLDLTAIGQNLDAEQWYEGLLHLLGRALKMENALEDYWLKHERLNPLLRWMSALRELVLPSIDDPLIVFIDEIDAVRNLPFSVDEFFAAIRECYNRRAEDPQFRRLSFCLLGVATPTDLIRDTRTTPFNIGRRIELTDFGAKEAGILAQGLRRSDDVAAVLMQRILFWTSGHPFLTQRLCQAVAEDDSILNSNGVDHLCALLFLSISAREQDDNFQFVRDRLLRSEVDLASLLDLYRRVVCGKQVKVDEANPLMGVLRLSGITRSAHGLLLPRNRIYYRVFDRAWIRDSMPDAEVRRVKGAYRKGLLRAATVSIAVLAAISALAVSALRSERRAQRAANDAREKSRQLQVALIDRDSANTNLRKALADARRQRNLANAQTNRANIAATSARESNTRALDQARLARQRLVRMHVTNGMRLADEGDYFGALPWLSEAARLDEGDALREHVHAMRLAEVARRCPALLQFWMHPDLVASVAYSHDGRHVSVATRDGSVKIWDAETGALSVHPFIHPHLKTQPPGDWAVRQVTFSPNDRLLATAGADGTARIWSIATGKPAAPPLRHEKAVNTACFSPDNRSVVTASDDGTAQLWDAATGGKRFAPFKHRGAVYCANFSPDGKSVLTASADKTVCVWAVSNGKLCFSLQHNSPVRYAVFSPDCRRIATCYFENVCVFSVETRQAVTPDIWVLGSTTGVSFSPDSRKIVVSDGEGAARILDASTGATLGPILRHRYSVDGVSFSPDGRWVLTYGGNSARIWDAATGEPVSSCGRHTQEVFFAAFNPDGGKVVTASRDGLACLWDLADSTGRPPMKHSGHVFKVVFSPDGSRYLTGENDGSAQLWDSATGLPLGNSMKHEDGVLCASFSADGRLVATGSGDWWQLPVTGTARVWNAFTGNPVSPVIRLPVTARRVELSPDGRRLLTQTPDCTLQLWDTRSGLPVTRPLGPHAGPGTIEHFRIVEAQIGTFSVDGQSVLIVYADGSNELLSAVHGKRVAVRPYSGLPVRHPSFTKDGRFALLIDANTVLLRRVGRPGPPIFAFQHNSEVLAASFSPGGERVLTAGRDGEARIWDTRSGRLLVSLPHHDWVFNATFSPDGSQVLTASRDHTARVWDSLSGEPLTPPLRHGSHVIDASFSPDGRLVVTASRDRTARGWEVFRNDWSQKDLRQLAELMSGERIDPTGAVIRIGASRRYTDWQMLGSRYAASFGDAGNREAARLLRDADQAENAQQWHTFQALLGKLIALQPKNWLHLFRRAQFFAGIRQWHEAIADYSRVIYVQPNNPDVWSARGEAFASLGQMKNAAADFKRAVACQPDDLHREYLLAVAQLGSSEVAEYRRTCARIAKNRRKSARLEDRFGIMMGLESLYWSTWTRVLSPEVGPDLALSAQLSEKVARNPQNGRLIQYLGAALYREGKYELAIQRLRECGAGKTQPALSPDKSSPAYGEFFLAMALLRLGKSQEARKSLADGIQLANQELNANPPPVWNRRVTLNLLRREAEALIQP